MKIKISNTVLNCMLAALATGIIFAEYFHPPLKTFVLICAASSVGAIIVTWKKNFSVTAKIIGVIIFFAIGTMRFNSVDILPPNDISKFAGQSINVTGIVREDPTTKFMSNDMYQMRLVVDVESVKVKGVDTPTCGAMILTTYNHEGNFEFPRIGDKVSAEGNLKLITNYKNPGQIDGVTRLKSDGITARMSAGKNGIEIEPVEGNFWTKFLRFIAAIREHYRAAMASVMSAEDAAAIFAMLFGGYAGLNPELVEEFQTTGIVHILSVSGSHMSILAMAVAWLCKTLRFSRRLTLALGIFVIGTYTLLSGMLPQVIRSAIMGILVFTATALEVEAIGARLLTLTALLMLIVKPLLIFDITFQLSFSATAGLIYLADDLRILMYRLPRFFSLPISITLSAQIASLPIIIWYFNQISLSSILSNIFVLPILELIIVVGILIGSSAWIIPILGKLVFIFEALIFGIGAELNRLFAKIPFSAIQVPTLGLGAGFVYYLAIIFRRAEIFLLMIIVLIFNFRTSGELEISFVDVGQGDCVVVLTPNRKCLIFDTGGVREKVFDVGGRVVLPYLKHEGVREVDAIFLTHAHEDHSGGAGAVIKKLPVHEIITAGEPKSEYAATFGISEKFLDNLRAGKVGEHFKIDGVDVEIIFAPNVGTGNELSNVYKIRYGDITFLITGDLIIENENQMLREGVDVKSTVLKVAHHGSKTSSSEEFLQAVNPKCAVICVGYGNNFGHPRAEVLERLENLGAKIFRTDIDGLIKFKTDGKKLSVETFVQ
ncbi:MAG: DNA internalization-related competence protein ComEC/Rec2 [Selenomonadaceae bacterium]|nr:DNA internalization-related competence protein ComEC/Rec2 [Selenomonadaceae bacterium]